MTDPAHPALYGESPDKAADLAASLGQRCDYHPKGRYRGEWWCEGDKLPGYTERNLALETAMASSGAYAIYSGALHADWHAVIGNWEDTTLPSGNTLVSRADREAIWSAVLVAAQTAVTPASRYTVGVTVVGLSWPGARQAAMTRPMAGVTHSRASARVRPAISRES